MVKIWGKLIKNNKIVNQEVATCDEGSSYQENLKRCITEICYRMDIPKPFWLNANLEEYNRRNKTSFTSYNFVEDIDFDKFIIEDIDLEEK